MINKDFSQYATQMWQCDTYIKPISEVSKSGKGKPLVNRSEKVYWFDGISNEIYTDLNNKPSSVDGLFFTKDTVYFVEFKAGFKKHRTKDNFDDEYSRCPKFDCFCKDYKDWFFQTQDKETEELKRSIRFKAIESYITLEKQILPCCKETGNCKLSLLVVVDVDAVEDYENTLSELGGEYTPIKTTDNNEIQSISSSLKSYSLKKDKHTPNGEYFYDTIEVMSVDKFEKFFGSILNKVISPAVNNS